MTTPLVVLRSLQGPLGDIKELAGSSRASLALVQSQVNRILDLVGPIEFSVYGPVAAVHQVVPGMRFLGEDKGTILFVNGGSAVKPGRNVTGTSIAFAGQAAYVELLHEVLAEEGIHVAQLIIGGQIIEGDPEKDPDVLAEHLWKLHEGRDTFRQQISAD